MRSLAVYSVLLNDDGYQTKVSEENEEIRLKVAFMSDKTKFTDKELQDFKILWADVKCHCLNFVILHAKFIINSTKYLSITHTVTHTK